MNIGIDIRTLQIHSRYQGIGQYSRQLLIHLLREGSDEQFYLFKARGVPFCEEEIRNRCVCVDLIRPPEYGRFNEVWDWTLAFLDYRRRPLDVLHIPSIHHLSFHYPCPVVLTVHDLIPLVYPDDYMKTGLKHKILYRFARRVNHVIAVSHSTKSDIVRMLKVPEERISVIYEAADPSCTPIRDPRFLQEVMSRYGIQGDFVLYVGGLSLHDPRKRIGLLLDSFSLLISSRRTPLSLVLAGKMGPYGEDLKKEVEQRGLTSRVCFTGYIPPENLPPLYNAARIFAYPSAYEGFGLPLVEAMACGTPTVAFRNSSITEVVGDGGMLLDKEDPVALKEAMSAILSSDEFASALTQRALNQTQRFSWKETAVQTLEVYREVVKQAGERRRGKGERA